MSKKPFLVHLFSAHGRNALNALNEFVVGLDPETATEAQLAELSEKLDSAARELAVARQDYKREQQEANAIETLYNQRLAAAGVLEKQLGEASNPDKRASMEESLSNLLTSIESMTADVEREKQEALDAKQFMDEVSAYVESAAETLKTARQQLEQAARAQKTAEMHMRRAQEQAERAERLAGIKQGGEMLGTAMKAMEARTKQFQIEADAARTRATLLAPTNAEKDDPNIVAAMAEVSGTPTATLSVSDRLAALRNREA